MLNNAPFYFHSIRNLVIAFGDVFNNVQVTKEDSDGNIVKTFVVPIAVARRQKYISRANEDQSKNEDSTASIIEMSLPRMAYDIVGIDVNLGDRINKLNQQAREIDTAGVKSYIKQMNGSPITVTLELSIYTIDIEEMLQIVEQIIPYFTPEFNVNILDIPELDIKKNVGIKLENIAPSDTYEGTFDDYRVIEWTISFTANIEIYHAIQNGDVIRKVITNIRDTN